MDGAADNSFDYVARARAVETARLANLAAAKRRGRDKPETWTTWEKTVEQFWDALASAYPPGFWEHVELLKRGDVRGLESVIRFLEADPWFFRSGYTKEELIRYIKRVPLSPSDKARLQQVVLAVIQGGDRQEFRRYCSLAKEIDTPDFRERVTSLLDSEDAGVRRRAQCVLAALTGQSLPPRCGKPWWPHGRTLRWSP
jgi:hypothetical protein